MRQTEFNSLKNFKVILLGETGAGKSSIISHLISDTPICLYDCNVEFGTKNIPIKDFSVSIEFFNMIDSSKVNMVRAKGLTNPFFKDTSLVIIVFDLSKPPYVDTVSRWFFEIEKHHRLFAGNFKILCLGTKADLKHENNFFFQSELLGAEINSFSKKFNQHIHYYEVSSSDCNSCYKLLDQIKILAESFFDSQNHFKNLYSSTDKNTIKPI